MNFKQKLSSRKLWASLAGLVSGLAMVFGLDEVVVSTMSGAVVSLASIIAYVVTEGRIDMQRLAVPMENSLVTDKIEEKELI